MKQNIRPDWFSTSLYEPIKEEGEWLNEIVTRLIMLRESDSDEAKKQFQKYVVDKNPIKLSEHFKKGDFELSDIWPVREINCLEVALLNKYMLDDELLKALKGPLDVRVNNPEDFFGNKKNIEALERSILMKSAVTPATRAGLDIRGEGMHYPITVDISQDDATLKMAFAEFLKDIRQVCTDGGLKTPKKRLGAKEFADWYIFSVLPCFDLTLWADMNEVHFTDPFLSDLLWAENNTPFDRVGRLRRTTRPLISEVINWNMVDRLELQIKFGVLDENMP